MKTRKRVGKVVLFVFGALLSAIYAIPFFLVILNAFKKKTEILKNPLSMPKTWEVENFQIAAKKMNYFQALTNSLLVTILSVSLIIIVSSLLAYYLARRQTRFSKVTFLILVASMIVPFQSLMIPFMGLFGTKGPLASLNMLSKHGLIFFYIGFGVAMSTFLYHGFISNIPYELDEAAMLDGATDMKIFRKIIFPMLTPVTATVAIINSLWIWNDFLLPSLVLYRESRTLPLSTYIFYGMYTSNYGQAMAGLVLAIVPIIIFYFVLQRHIISGISSGAVK